MCGFWLLALSVPLFGTSSDEGSEALPCNRVYLSKAGALKPKTTCTGNTRLI